MEIIGYILLAIAVICWIIAVIIGLIVAFPFGLVGLIAIIGIGILFAKVVKDRSENTEDNYYSKNIDK